jgi:hypothetical protein
MIADFFDVEFYVAQCPELAGTSTEPIFDFLERGWRLGLDPSPRFSTSYYLQINHDVASNGMNPLVHYLTSGREEGRRPIPHCTEAGNSSQRYQMEGLIPACALKWTDWVASHSRSSSTFRDSNRPVIRWIKCNGLDDVVTRSAIAQANDVFGDTVDYCLCTAGIGASRVREVLSWATQPVEWWPLDPADNPELAAILMRSGCSPEQFGYWWKWFPERVRPNAPEWILDGDMVVTGKPSWFSAWSQGADCLRVSQDDRLPSKEVYGEYLDLVDQSKRLYSGLISLAPGQRYMPEVLGILDARALAAEHDGRESMSEQGVLGAAFSRLEAVPIPLSEFPFAKAFDQKLDYGQLSSSESVWGYHFSHAFRQENPHFGRMIEDGKVIWRAEPKRAARHEWMRNHGQWGRPGWSMHPECVQRILELALRYGNKPVLEIGTSRGHLSAGLAAQGCLVTTLDREDRGAAKNLQDMNVLVVMSDAAQFLKNCNLKYALITADLHGNDIRVWQELWPLLYPCLAKGGTMALYNSHLWMWDEWKDETGLKWLMGEVPREFEIEMFPEPLPGMILIRQ